MLPSHKSVTLCSAQWVFSLSALPPSSPAPWLCLFKHLTSLELTPGLSGCSDVAVCLSTQSKPGWEGDGIVFRPLLRAHVGWAWRSDLNRVLPFGCGTLYFVLYELKLFHLVVFHLFGGLNAKAGSGRDVSWPCRVFWLQKLWTLPCCPFSGNQGHLSPVGAACVSNLGLNCPRRRQWNWDLSEGRNYTSEQSLSSTLGSKDC